jgi:thioredoxin 1|tara:strand:+ start:361 stop:618 length:258 start_codon:yes stop_codon:yes gene_type:complete
MTKVIKFYASWCGPCKVYGKIFDRVAEELKDSAEFISIDIESDTTGLAAEYKIRSIPFTAIVKEGKSTTKTGVVKEAELKELILN